jgi:3-oxoacyl-[acyl-carrier protein] reductase
METLSNKIFLVGGGAGEVGEGITRQLMRAGATVVIPTRYPEKIKAFQHTLPESGRLITVEGNVGDPKDAERVRDEVINKTRVLNAVVASLGGWFQGTNLTDLSLDLWTKALDNNLTPHFLFAKTFLPLIADSYDSTYTMINGGSALIPFPTGGHISIAASAQIMMKNVLTMENKDKPVRINTLVLATPIATRSRSGSEPNWLTADEVGSYVTYLASNRGRNVQGETIVFDSRSQLSQIF